MWPRRQAARRKCQQGSGCGISPETVAKIRLSLAPPPAGGRLRVTAVAMVLPGGLAGAEPGPVTVGPLGVAGPAVAELPGPAEESGTDRAVCLSLTAAAAGGSPLGTAADFSLGTARAAAAMGLGGALEGGRGVSGMRLRAL